MKKAILLLALLAGFKSVSAQQQGEWCGTEQKLKEAIAIDPSVKEAMIKGMYKAFHSDHGLNGEAKTTQQIPVVVHVLHDNGFGNISDDQIINALEILNLDYNRLNADTADTRDEPNAPFKQYAASMDVEFKLARIDPDGNCTNGIVRVNASQTYNATDDCKFTSSGGDDAWPADSYFNIWVVNTIESSGAGITLGYAQFPYWGSPDTYGIVVRNDSFGTIGTALGSDGRTLTHEVGHCFGLAHIFDEGWNDGCNTNDCSSSGDMCCDTPPQSAANWSCNGTWNSCNDIPQNDPYGFDTYDQIENYMSYNSCQNMFSTDQANGMATNLTDIPMLASLVSAANGVATGINNADFLCKADFSVNNDEVCSGSIVDFSDYSYHAPTTWSWSVSPGTEGVDYNFVGGTDASSQNPSIEFITGGYYDIELTASDGTLSDTETKQSYIHVLPVSGSLPFLEKFESYTDLNSTEQWTVYNPGNNYGFELFTGFGHTGNKCIGISNFNEPGVNTDEVIGAPVDLSVVDTSLNEIVTMTFRYAYRKRNATDDEWLKVFISSDCGNSWAQRKTIHGTLLSSIVETSSWQPASQTEWTTVHMTNITAAYFVDNFLYKFEFEGSGGNNFYLDNINIYKGSPSDQLVGVEAIEDEISGFSLYPNPADDQLNVRFAVAGNNSAKITITDLAGKTVETISINAATGANLAVLDTQGLAAGAYLLKLEIGGVTRTERFIIK